jgi:hypothetical protein
MLARVAGTQELERVERVPEGLWERLRAEPERAAELIALAAAERFHDPARRWAERMAATHGPEKMARAAKARHVRLAAAGGAATGLGGALTVVPNVLGLIWIQSRMVFFIAASYGYDPAHPMRPAELLVLGEIYPTAAEARAALDGVGTPLPLQMIDATLSRDADQALRQRLIRYAYRHAGKRLALKAVPILSSPLSAAQNARATSDLGARAVRYYGG